MVHRTITDMEQQLCRVCMTSDVQLVDIFVVPLEVTDINESASNWSQQLEQHQAEEPSLAEMLTECTDCEVKRDDALPQLICLGCVLAARNAFRFKRQCEQSYSQFLQLLRCNGNVNDEMSGGGVDNGGGGGGGEIVEIECIKLEEEPTALMTTVPHAMASDNTNDGDTDRLSVTTQSVAAAAAAAAAIDKSYRCAICERGFTTRIYLVRHLSLHERKRFACKECGTRCVTRDELSAHVKERGHDKPMLCPECGLRCKTSHTLMVHMRRHNGERPFECKFCSKGFPRMDDLRVHEKYHTGEKSHFCETCGKGFLRKYNLTIHTRVHTGERPYKCPHCPQAFAQGNDLKAHIRRHTGERFRCEFCQAAFLQHYKIRQHKLLEHGINEGAATQRVAKFTSIEEQQQQIKLNAIKHMTRTTPSPPPPPPPNITTSL